MKNKFNTYENNPQFIYCLADSETAIDCISIEMIQHNRKSMSFLVPMRFEFENGEIKKLEYNLTGLTSVKAFFEKFAVNKKRFSDIAEQILLCLESAGHYMLPDNQLYLEMDKVYLDLATMKASLICVPFKSNREAYDLRRFFIECIENVYLDVESENESANFQKIYDMLPNQTVTIDVMRSNLGILLRGEEKEDISAAHSAPAQAPADILAQPREDIVDVVQEAANATPMKSVPGTEKKSSGILGKIAPAYGNLMSMFRSAQGSKAAAIPVSTAKLDTMIPSGQPKRVAGSGRTILILHDDPDENAFLVYGAKRIRIDAEGTAIGRAGGNADKKVDIFLDSIHVSSYHAVITYDFDNMNYTVTDYSSTGTRLNGSRLPKGESVKLIDNDMLIFADVACRILLEKNSDNRS